MANILIADSGSSNTTWTLVSGKAKKKVTTQGLSPYFLDASEMAIILGKELLPKLKNTLPDEIHFYGTGCADPANRVMIRKMLKGIFPKTKKIQVETDLLGTARALCGKEKGIVCILGTGSNSCFYNGKSIVKNSPGLGFILGDEGSGAYLGKKVIQHVLYGTFEPELMDKFHSMFPTSKEEILEAVYRQPLPNRYLAGFVKFLIEERGHFMVENIIEDAFNDFFFQHIYKYRESWSLPIHFTGSVAYGFRDVLKLLCTSYELKLGKVLKDPMDGLIKYHS
jgi:N-acetylglucosamine kinase-like BadF-type ATPase